MSNASPSLMPPGNRWGSSGWLRYFPFEHRSWRKIIADSEMSAEAKAIVESVVSGSRLMRFEKLEVVHELISHFVDGEMAGCSYSQLVADFGNPDLAAKLIRRSKIRNRPVMFRALSIFGWGLLALAGLYASFAAYFHMGMPQPSVDYMADFNNSIDEADESDLAWPIYRPLWKKHGFSEGGGLNVDQLYHRVDEAGVLVHKGMKKPEHLGWEDAVERLSELNDLLDGFREARYKPRLGVPLFVDRSNYSREDFEVIFPNQDYEDPYPNFNDESVDAQVAEVMEGSPLYILLPHIQAMRTGARILTVDTRWAIEQGDSDRVVANIEAILGIGRQAADSNFLVGSLVGYACAGIGFDLIEEVLTEHPDCLNQNQLAQLQRSLENEDPTKWMNIQGERAFVMDTIQRVYTDDGNGDGRVTATGIGVMQHISSANFMASPLEGSEEEPYFKAAIYVAAPASLFLIASRKETTTVAEKFLQQFEDQIDRPYWEKAKNETDFEEFLAANERRHFLLANLMPAFNQVRLAMIRTMARRDGVVVGIAGQRHYLKYGEWPNSFDQLSPEFIIEFPLDPMNGQFLRVKAEHHGVLAYSVGHDLDDDGGAMPVYGRRYRDHRGKFIGNPPHAFVGGDSNATDFDADWILWPQADWKSRLPANVTDE